MNSFCIQGTISKDPELRYLPDGKIDICRFKIEGKENNAEAKPFELVCTAKNGLVDKVMQQYKTGHQVTMEGYLKMNLIDRNGTKHKVPELICTRIHDTIEMPF